MFMKYCAVNCVHSRPIDGPAPAGARRLARALTLRSCRRASPLPGRQGSTDWRPLRTRIAQRLEGPLQVGVDELVGTADALRDRVAGQLDMHAAGPGAAGGVGREEAADLGQHVVEVAGLAPRLRGVGVAVHRIARPGHRVP